VSIERQAPQLVVEKDMEQLMVVSIEYRDYRIVGEVGHALDRGSRSCSRFHLHPCTNNSKSSSRGAFAGPGPLMADERAIRSTMIPYAPRL